MGKSSVVISNTEIGTYNLCERQHFYRFRQNIEPRRFSLNTPLGIGIIGHEAFEQYYLVLKEGGSVDSAYRAAKNRLQQEIDVTIAERPYEFAEINKLMHLVHLFEAYTERYRVEPFKVLAVEEVFKTPVTEEIEYGLKLDLLVEYTAGPHRGSVVVFDHKFVYNFKSRAVIEMDTQLPKYIHTLRSNGYPASFGVFNQVRYRELKNPSPDDLFARVRLTTKKVEIDNIWSEQKYRAQQIYSDVRRDLPPIRTQHLLTCRGCMFQQLCKAELMDLDTEKMRIANFQQSKYGYTDMTSIGDMVT